MPELFCARVKSSRNFCDGLGSSIISTASAEIISTSSIISTASIIISSVGVFLSSLSRFSVSVLGIGISARFCASMRSSARICSRSTRLFLCAANFSLCRIFYLIFAVAEHQFSEVQFFSTVVFSVQEFRRFPHYRNLRLRHDGRFRQFFFFRQQPAFVWRTASLTSA